MGRCFKSQSRAIAGRADHQHLFSPSVDVLEKIHHAISNAMITFFPYSGSERVKRHLLSDEAHFWLNGYVNKQNCRIWSEANPQVYVETPLHPEKLTVWCALWAGGIILQKR
ncbi:hypothetical protein TNCV_2964871 [Trichonephila clavipes]|nr:hypothetical protein TNCV_2964871 [Trichonephila clavipes]